MSEVLETFENKHPATIIGSFLIVRVHQSVSHNWSARFYYYPIDYIPAVKMVESKA